MSKPQNIKKLQMKIPTHKYGLFRRLPHLPTETLKTRASCSEDNASKALEVNNCQPRLLYLAMVSFKNYKKIIF